jgi:chemotaxis signal transduction protein
MYITVDNDTSFIVVAADNNDNAGIIVTGAEGMVEVGNKV